VPIDQCAGVGDSTPDAPLLRGAGLPSGGEAAPPHPGAAADLLTTRAGGHGAVREVCDWLIDARRLRA
jgi:3-deoxy-D-manno-octulosonate 8-phosphate phosphatase (KDO 8-P phosphatase)